MKDCTTCKYGFVDERLGFPMCHHPKRFSEDCVDFNMHEEIEEPKKATGIEEKKLPEGLEEAAGEIVAKLVPTLGQKYEDGSYVGGTQDYFSREELIGLVKAGAEWMMKQGVNHELEVKADAGGYPYIDKTFELYDYTEDKPIFNPGDKVIVNIRKKEDKK